MKVTVESMPELPVGSHPMHLIPWMVRPLVPGLVLQCSEGSLDVILVNTNTGERQKISIEFSEEDKVKRKEPLKIAPVLALRTQMPPKPASMGQPTLAPPRLTVPPPAPKLGISAPTPPKIPAAPAFKLPMKGK